MYINLFENQTNQSVVLNNTSVLFGDVNNFTETDFGFYIGDSGSKLVFGAETKLIASGNKFYGIYAKQGITAQGKMIVENNSANEVVGIYLNNGSIGRNTQPLELQIIAQEKDVIGIYGMYGGIYNEIKITKFSANSSSYIFKDDGNSRIGSGGSLYVSQTGETPSSAYILYSNIDGARYSFGGVNKPTQMEYLDGITDSFAGVSLVSSAKISGNIKINGENGVLGSSVGNIYGIYSSGESKNPLTIDIENDTSISLKGHSNQGGYSGKTYGIFADGRDTVIQIASNSTFALKFFKDSGHTSSYTGFYIKNSTLSFSSMDDGQKIIFDSYEHNGEENLNYPKFGDNATIIKISNGGLRGKVDFYVDGTNASVAYTRFGLNGIESDGTSFLDGKIIFQKDFFKDVVRPGHSLTVTVPILVWSNQGNFTLNNNALIFSENFNNESGAYLINNTGSIVFQSGAKAIFGQEYAKLSEITQEGIYLAKDTGRISTSSMTFKGNAGISVASGATLNMTLSSGTLEFNGSNESQEMVAFNALQSSDPNITQGKINLTINKLNSSIIFTKAQGGMLETLESLVSNPISSASTDKNTIVNLAGIAQDSSQSREVEGKLATRSLTIKNANIKNVNFITYVNPNISTSNVEIANFDGRAYSNSNGGVASFGASDRIIIENNLGNSGNNTFSIAIAPNQSTKNMSGYMLVGKVKTSSNLIFNDLQNGGSKNITAYSGLRTTTLTLHRSDVGDYSYYYVTSAQDSTTPTPPSGGGSTGGGEVGGGGSEGGNGGDEMIPPIGGGDNENNGNNGQTPPSPTPQPDEGNEEVVPPPSNDNNAPVGDDNIDVPNVGVAPLTRSAFKTNFALVSSTLNSLNKRLGDIRSLENVDGVWARVFVGEEIFKDTLQTNAVYTSIQAGYDHAIGLESDTDFIGFALAWVGSDTKSQEDSYQVSPIDFINGTNTIKTNGVELALYNTYLSHLGLYTDSIIKFGYYSSDVSMPMMESFVLDDFSFSLSQEVGYQARLGEKKEWMITPQMEIAYAFVSGSNATQNLLMTGVDNVMDISQSASHLLRMRAGVDWGYSFDGWSEIVSKADVHLGTSYEYDVISGGEMTYSLPNMGTYKEKGMDCNGRFVLNVGTNIYIKETASIYFDFEKSFGDTLYKNYQANLGARFSFGEKIHKIQDEKTQSAPLSIPNSQQSEDQDNNQNNKE